MPAFETTEPAPQTNDQPIRQFPPVFKTHILHCSFHSWHPQFRTITPKARLVPLTKPFVDYLRADGIILPDDDDDNDNDDRPQWSDNDSGVFSASDTADADDSDEDEDIAADWRQVHRAIRATIDELGGRVVPKLNWSSPKDATWMNANTMECRNPNDVYLLLKSSDFVTHDLEHAFDDCVDAPGSKTSPDDIPYHLVLRKHIGKFNPSLEFRCFVRERKLLCICQRDLNHYEFLFDLQDRFSSLIKEFFEVRIRDVFPDENFVFDAYIPPPYDRVWLIDFNPWAPRTDPLLFSWKELLEMSDPPTDFEPDSDDEAVVRLPLRGSSTTPSTHHELASTKPPTDLSSRRPLDLEKSRGQGAASDDSDADSDDEFDEEIWLPELRLVLKTDPEARNFSTPQYSAHKLPRDVVDASQGEGGLREFARDWQNILAKRQAEEAATADSDKDE